MSRLVVAMCALLLCSSALFGVGFSGAVWTSNSNTGVSVTASPDWIPPDVQLGAVPSGVVGTVRVTATASDTISAIPMFEIEWALSGSNDWQPLGSCTTSGAGTLTRSCSWDTTTLPDNDYQLRARATDAEGNQGFSAIQATSIANSGQAVLEPIASPIRGVVAVTGHLYNAGNHGTTLGLQFKPSSDTAWTPLQSPTGCSGKDNPIICQWDTGSLPDGAYDVQLFSSGGWTDLQTGIIVDNHAPTDVAISVPTGTLSGIVTLTATAEDAPAGLESVALKYQLAGSATWSTCGTPDTSEPYSCELNTTLLTSGATYAFKAVARDRGGLEADSALVTRTVDNSPASVALTNPLTGSVVTGSVPVTVTASSPTGVDHVEVQYRGTGNWTSLCTDASSPYTCSWNTDQVPTGSYALRAVLTTGSSTTVTSTVQTVSVDHSVGTVGISAPASGASYGPDDPGTVTVTGHTSSPQGVSAVVLRATPTSPVGAVISTPCTLGSGTFSCAWDIGAIAYGEFDLRAEMTQGNGVVVTSASPVHVTIDHVDATVTLGVAPTPKTPASYVAGTETFTAAVTTNVDVSKVAFAYRSSPSGTFQPLCQADTTAPYTCDWNTGSLSGGQPVYPNGTYAVQAVATLVNGDTRPATTSVNLQNLRAVDVQGVASPDLALQTGEALTFTYSTKVLPSSVVSTWDGVAPVSIPVTFTKGKPGGGTGATLTAGNLGQVVFDQDYVKTGNAYVGTAHASRDPNHENRIILTFDDNKLGSSFHQGPGGGVMVWTPTTAVTGAYAGGTCAAGAVSESGTVDAEF